MERQRRASELPDSSLWTNPCDYKDSNEKVEYSATYARELVEKAVHQAKHAYASAAAYKDTFALELHSYSSFDALLSAWAGNNWLQNFSWFRDEALPKEKKLNHKMPDQYMDQLMENINDILPYMYKGLQMIVAGLDAFSRHGLDGNIISEANFKNKINQTMNDVRAVLCLFNDVMKARNLTIMPIENSEVPDFNIESRLTDGLLLYIDTMNYMEYLSQVFQKLYEMESKKKA